MRRVVIALAIFLCAALTCGAQTRKKPRPRQPARTEARPPASRMVGSPIVIITKNGDRINGELLDLTAFSVRYRSGTLESVLALDTISSVSFGTSPVVSRPQPSVTPVRPEFVQDAGPVLTSLQGMANQTRAGVDYNEYNSMLSELRRAVERFVQEYSSTDNPVEARAVAHVAGALTDYNWARAVWTLKLGRSTDGTVSENDSPNVSDALALYPDLRTSAASGNRFLVDKITSGLWRKAAEKGERARALVAQPR